MKYYESVLVLRRMNNEKLNGYDIHTKVENLVINECGVNTEFSFLPLAHPTTDRIHVLIRTLQALNLPGEQVKSLNLEEGESLSFSIDLHTSKNAGPESKKKIAITDPDERIIKMLNIGEKNGLDCENVNEIESYGLFIKKGKKPPFAIAGTRFHVTATVTDRSAFEKAFVAGLGQKRSFGFGMLVLLEEADYAN